MAITDEKDADGMIWCKSLVSNTTHEGVVEFTWGEHRAQLTCEEAREHARGVMECAEAAETDAFLVEYFVDELKLEFERAVMMMRQFRGFREQRLKEKQH